MGPRREQLVLEEKRVKHVQYATVINAKPETVWEAMIDLGVFDKWVTALVPNSRYEGDWKDVKTCCSQTVHTSACSLGLLLHTCNLTLLHNRIRAGQR